MKFSRPKHIRAEFTDLPVVKSWNFARGGFRRVTLVPRKAVEKCGWKLRINSYILDNKFFEWCIEILRCIVDGLDMVWELDTGYGAIVGKDEIVSGRAIYGVVFDGSNDVWEIRGWVEYHGEIETVVIDCDQLRQRKYI